MLRIIHHYLSVLLILNSKVEVYLIQERKEEKAGIFYTLENIGSETRTEYERFIYASRQKRQRGRIEKRVYVSTHG